VRSRSSRHAHKTEDTWEFLRNKFFAPQVRLRRWNRSSQSYPETNAAPWVRAPLSASGIQSDGLLHGDFPTWRLIALYREGAGLGVGLRAVGLSRTSPERRPSPASSVRLRRRVRVSSLERHVHYVVASPRSLYAGMRTGYVLTEVGDICFWRWSFHTLPIC
jgi:hypothetical protein